MYKYFTNNCLSIILERDHDNNLRLHISSDYANGNYHKQKLYIDEKRFAISLEDLWKSIKTKKLQSIRAGFGEIDYYDNMTDIYTTPVVSMMRGKRKAEIEYCNHGSIPKDWSMNLSAVILNTTTINPILEVIETAIGLFRFEAIKKELVKMLRPVLQKKKTYVNYYKQTEE
jgi:hypothetical protein